MMKTMLVTLLAFLALNANPLPTTPPLTSPHQEHSGILSTSPPSLQFPSNATEMTASPLPATPTQIQENDDVVSTTPPSLQSPQATQNDTELSVTQFPVKNPDRMLEDSGILMTTTSSVRPSPLPDQSTNATGEVQMSVTSLPVKNSEIMSENSEGMSTATPTSSQFPIETTEIAVSQLPVKNPDRMLEDSERISTITPTSSQFQIETTEISVTQLPVKNPDRMLEDFEILTTATTSSIDSPTATTNEMTATPLNVTNSGSQKNAEMVSTPPSQAAQTDDSSTTQDSRRSTSSSPSPTSSESEVTAAPTVKPWAPALPKSMNQNVKYAVLVLKDEEYNENTEDVAESSAFVQPTKYWDNYDMREWHRRQHVKARALRELLYGKNVPSVNSDEMMEVIPDYGEGIHYSEEDLKNMGIVRKRVE